MFQITYKGQIAFDVADVQLLYVSQRSVISPELINGNLYSVKAGFELLAGKPDAFSYSSWVAAANGDTASEGNRFQ